MRHLSCMLLAGALAWVGRSLLAQGDDGLARDRPAGEIEVVATFEGPMPTGVTELRA